MFSKPDGRQPAGRDVRWDNRRRNKALRERYPKAQRPVTTACSLELLAPHRISQPGLGDSAVERSGWNGSRRSLAFQLRSDGWEVSDLHKAKGAGAPISHASGSWQEAARYKDWYVNDGTGNVSCNLRVRVDSLLADVPSPPPGLKVICNAAAKCHDSRRAARWCSLAVEYVDTDWGGLLWCRCNMTCGKQISRRVVNRVCRCRASRYRLTHRMEGATKSPGG